MITVCTYVTYMLCFNPLTLTWGGGVLYHLHDPCAVYIQYISNHITCCFCFVFFSGAKDTCRGFGYVTFALAEDAQRAMETLKTFKGRQIKVSFAEKKPRHKKRKLDKKEDAENDDGGMMKKNSNFRGKVYPLLACKDY